MRFRTIVFLWVVFCMVGQATARDRVCDPFTTTPDAGMLPVGTVVLFTDYGVGGMFTREGRIQAYYIASCFPGALVPGLDAQAYVIDYGEPAMVVLNRDRFAVK